ncbi:uncharacterized protein LOC111045589 isoform X2 [Nilaparvata lugens]|nr:uncharacterized protein LOC111045589 isoform X2 [Nilaparvata lugens]
MSKSVFASNKILVLQQIREKKAVLFGKFSDEVCKAQKIDAWKEIHSLALGMGVVGPDKQWTYTRDVLWQNARKSTMKKVDNQKKTGSAGGPEWKLNTLDNIVLDIIGRDSSVLTDLGVAETWSIEQDPPEQAEHSSFEVEVPADNVVAPAVPEATTTSAATASTSSASSTPFTATSTRARA